MKNKVKLLPAPDRIWNYNGTRAHGVYSDARYTFSDPTPERDYVKVLACARDLEKTVPPTRNEIKRALNQPTHPGWGASKFNALTLAGLLEHYRVGNKVFYHVPARGRKFLAQIGV